MDYRDAAIILSEATTTTNSWPSNYQEESRPACAISTNQDVALHNYYLQQSMNRQLPTMTTPVQGSTSKFAETSSRSQGRIDVKPE